MIRWALAEIRSDRRVDPAPAQLVELVGQHLRVDHDAVPDHAQRVLVQDPRRDQVQLERLPAADDRVAGVVAALEAHDGVGPLGEQVGDLSLAFVAPLGADQYDSGHRRMSVRTVWAQRARAGRSRAEPEPRRGDGPRDPADARFAVAAPQARRSEPPAGLISRAFSTSSIRLPHGSAVKNRRVPGIVSSHWTLHPAVASRSATPMQLVRAEQQRGMGLGRRHERLCDAHVELMSAACEPDPAARAERLRLGQFGHAEQPAVEPSGVVLAPAGRGDLDVVEPDRRGCARHHPIIASRRAGRRRRYVLAMDEQPKTEELKIIQTEREADERRRAQEALDEDEAAQHDRRADKARYLREKLEERADSERRLEE